jgi:hypothetical protein
MSQSLEQEGALTVTPAITSQMTLARLAIGIVQGLVLYLLYRAAKTDSWPVTIDYLFAPLLMVSLFAPVILVASLGHLGKKQAVLWISVVVAVVAGLAFFDVWRGAADSTHWFGGNKAERVQYPSSVFTMFCAAGLYIAHALVLAGVIDKRRIATYPSYFESAWKLAVQIKFSLLFVAALWLVLWLGAALFNLVQLSFLEKLLQQSWFAIPVTVFAFTCAIHVTDVRPAIVRGIRTLLLVLMSWILPITTLMVGGFLLSLPWTGLDPLWKTRHATAVLLGASAVLVILINAAFQNGEGSAKVPFIVRMSARAAAFSLLPMAAVAIYSLWLRVAEYGWTTDRIIAAACLLVASCYALGYAWAASRKAGWLQPIAGVNVVTAFVVLAVLLALFSPIADPARISVNSQMARFVSGKVSAKEFDYDYLRFDGARYGMAALMRLKEQSVGQDADLVREKAELALNKKNRWEPSTPKPGDLAANIISVWPKEGELPASFLETDWSKHSQRGNLPPCLTTHEKTCHAYLIDFDIDDKPEVLLIGTAPYEGGFVMAQVTDGSWMAQGKIAGQYAGCRTVHEMLAAGDFRLIPPQMKDIEVDWLRIEVQPVQEYDL